MPTQKLTTEQIQSLAARMHAGDIDARNQLLLSIMPWIVHLAIKRNRQFPGIDRDELVSESVIHILRHIHRFDPARGRLTTYVSYLICSAHRDFLCKHERRLKFERRYNEISDGDRYESPPSEEIDQRQSVTKAHQAISAARKSLSPRENEVLRRRMNGDHLDVVGKAMGICKERVRQLQNRAVQRLRTDPQVAAAIEELA